MPTVPKTHKDNQVSICGLCLVKSPKQLRNITDTTLELESSNTLNFRIRSNVVLVILRNCFGDFTRQSPEILT